MSRFCVLLDACVLVPISLADTLLRLAEADLFRPLWSARLLDEMQSAIEAVHPELAEGAARRRRDQMETFFEDALVEGWEPLETSVLLPDPDDRHAVAAALAGRADLIVTGNVKDFPPATLGTWDLEVQSPDDFLLNQLDLDPDRVMHALQRQVDAARNPRITLPVLVASLARAGAPRFAAEAAGQRWRLNHDHLPRLGPGEG